jgi:hypothetical protein
MKYKPPTDADVGTSVSADNFVNTAINSIDQPQDSSLEGQGFNVDDYKEELGVETFSKEEVELLQAWWNIMSMCVDIGWGVDTVQLVCPELVENIASSCAELPPNPVNDNTKDTDENQYKTKGGSK